jgi:hypothetical protein
MEEMKMKCELCGKEYNKMGIKSHIWRMHGEGKDFDPNIGYKTKKRIVWNKGLTKETDKRVEQNGLALIGKPSAFKGKHHTDETKAILSKTGGYRPGSGRGKSGWYKGFWCDSSWELAYVIYCLENHIRIQRNTKKFEYIFENKIYHYTPDYELNDQRYIEVKGYSNEKWPAKVEQFPCQLTILGKKEMKPILQYVRNKYGKDFIKMYEKRSLS